MTQDTIKQNLRSFIEQTGTTAVEVLRAAEAVAGRSSPEADGDTWTVVAVRKEQSPFETLHVTETVSAESAEVAFRQTLAHHADIGPEVALDTLRAASAVEIVGVFEGARENAIGDVSPAYADG